MSANPGTIKYPSHIESRQRNERLSLLSDIAGLLLLSDDPREILDNIFKMLSAHLGLEAYFNYLVTDDGSRMRLYEYGGIPADVAKEIEWLDFGQAVCGCVARDRGRIVAEDVQRSPDPRADLIRSLGITAYCCHPLIAHGKLLGTLSFGTRGRTMFGDDEVELMQTACNLVATSLERAKLISNLKSSQAELEDKVRERTLELQEKQEKLHANNEELKAEIAERRRAEEALRESEETLRRIIDSSPVPMVLYHEKKNNYFYNKKFTETFGYSIADVPTINEWWELAYPDEKYRASVKKRWYAAVDDAEKHKTSIAPLEVDVTCKDGSKRHILNEFSSIGDVNLSVLYDITELKRAGEALRKSEAELARAQMISKIGSWTWDFYTGELTWSDQSYRNYGLVSGEVKPTYELFLSFIVPEDRERVDKTIQKAIETGEKYNVIYNIVRKDGEPRVLLSENEIVTDDSGKVIRMYGTNQDITERKRAEEALRNSERLYRAIGESIDYGVWVCAPDGRNIYASESFLKLVGLTQQQCSDFGWGDVLHPEDAGRTITAWKECVRTKGVWDIEHRYRGVDGRWHPILARGVPVRDEHGHIIYWAGINLDISGLKRTEAELKEAKMQAELYLDLMGHDISNMHQIGLGRLELAQEIMAEQGRLESEDKELIDTPIEALNRSARLIDNVRKLQKVRAGEYERETIDLGALLEDVVREHSSISGTDATFNYTMANGCYVKANPLLKDVFGNLVGNAIKHSKGPATINIGLGRIDDHGSSLYRVSIEDHGPGIPDEKKIEVFHRFKRGQTQARGTGLGLYIVQTLVESFHGHVKVEDRVHGDHTKGSRFLVDLPVAEDEHGK